MRTVASEEGRYVFNLARGEELFEVLRAHCKKEGVAGATLTGLGAADKLELAYYNLHTKTYERHQRAEEVEILSLVGNVGAIAGEQILHIHGVFGRRDLATFGGHLFALRVSGACEIHLTTFKTSFERAFDKETGLNLLCEATK